MHRHIWLALALVACDNSTDKDTTDDSMVDDTMETDTVDTLDTDDTDDTDVVDTDVFPRECLQEPGVLRVGWYDESDVFHEWVDGQDVYLERGLQGCCHVPVTFEVENSEQLVIIQHRLVLIDGEEVVGHEDPDRDPLSLIPLGDGQTWTCDGFFINLFSIVKDRWLFDAYDTDEDTDTDPDTDVPFDSDTDSLPPICGREIRVEVTVLDAFGALEIASKFYNIVVQPDPIDAPACH